LGEGCARGLGGWAVCTGAGSFERRVGPDAQPPLVSPTSPHPSPSAGWLIVPSYRCTMRSIADGEGGSRCHSSQSSVRCRGSGDCPSPLMAFEFCLERLAHRLVDEAFTRPAPVEPSSPPVAPSLIRERSFTNCPDGTSVPPLGHATAVLGAHGRPAKSRATSSGEPLSPSS
jgi:hypothetical protein